MFKQLTLFLLLFIVILQINGQIKEIDIPLKIKTDIRTATYGSILYRGNTSHLKGVPKCVPLEDGVYKYLLTGNDTLFAYIGDINEYNRMCIIDIDLDRDFSNNFIYIQNRKSTNEKVTYPPLLMRHSLKDNIDKFYFFYISPVFDPKNYLPNDEVDKKYNMAFGINQYYIGEIKIHNNNYIVLIQKDNFSQRKPQFEYSIIDSVKFDNRKILQYEYKKNTTKVIINDLIIDSLSLSTNRDSLRLRLIDGDVTLNKKLMGSEVGFYAPKFNKNDIFQKEFNLNNFSGRYILLDFWGTWCKPCIALLPHIAEIHKKYPDLQIVSIAFEMNEADINKIPDFIKKYEMHWINIMDVNGESNTINALYNVSSYPTTVLISPDGKIIHRGSTDKISELDEKLKQAFLK